MLNRERACLVFLLLEAQIYNEIGDFHRLGAALEEILRDGKLANV